MKTLIKPRTGVLAAMVLAAGAWRLIFSGSATPLLHNFTPIGAMALFGGCYFADKWKAYMVPLLTLWLSDLLLSYFLYYHQWTWFYQGFLWNYGSFALMVMMGTFMKKVNIQNVLLAGIVAALAHWVITDLGVWLGDSIYPMNWQGFTACYAAAIPFLQNMLLGNILFGGIMFGAFEWAQKKYTVLAA